MPVNSQPLDDKVAKKMGLDDADYNDRTIMSQRIGKMFDFLDEEDRKIDLKTRIEWKWRSIKDFFYNVKYAVINHMKWHKTIRRLRPWEGFDGLNSVMQTHLRLYIDYEEKYGHSEENYKMRKISTAREVLMLLKQMKEPVDYSSKRRDAVDKRYPDYQYLITEYANSTSYSGDFVAQGNGWVGKESGNDPREGYFEFVDGRLELATSPNMAETDRLLADIHKYHTEIHEAYAQAEIDSEKDFDNLAQLLKENFYTWWD